MITLLVAFLAGVLNAFMDTIEEGHFAKSIFQKWDPRFWYKWQSWKYAKVIPILKYPIDAWHLAKSGWWASFCAVAIVYHRAGPIFPHWVLDFCAIGGTSMLTFDIFYNHIFKKP